MGDEVKITVIATGFRQQMPERRKRLLDESTLLSANEEIPARYRSVAANGNSDEASSTPRENVEAKDSVAAKLFASEAHEARVSRPDQPRLEQPVETSRQSFLATPTSPSVSDPSGWRSFTTPDARGCASAVLAPAVPYVETAQGCGLSYEIDADAAVNYEAESQIDEESCAGDAVVSGTANDDFASDGEPQFYSASNPQRDCVSVVREPELVPVPASVFDDDFFRTPRRPRVIEEVNRDVKAEAEVRAFSFSGSITRADAGLPTLSLEGSQYDAPQFDSNRQEAAHFDVPEQANELRLFAGARGSHPSPAESDSGVDELDIPAFLRRGH